MHKKFLLERGGRRLLPKTLPIFGLEVHPLFCLLNMSDAPVLTMLRHLPEPYWVGAESPCRRTFVLPSQRGCAIPTTFDDARAIELQPIVQVLYVHHTNISASGIQLFYGYRIIYKNCTGNRKTGTRGGTFEWNKSGNCWSRQLC